MSSEEDKFKRSKRRHKNQAAAHKQAQIAKSHGIPVDDEHRFNKVHALNCGDPKCSICSNPRKFYKEETIQEKSFKQKEIHDE